MKVIEEKNRILLIAILVIGILLRIIAIDKIPIGLNVDEAGMAYDAFSIANYGTDRYGNPYPIYMINYGGGQSALYTYLAAILIKLFGFRITIIRIPAFLFSILYMIMGYFLVKEWKNQKLALLVEFLIVICPWHFMQSRWGLDCNLMSALMLLSIYLLLRARSNKGYVLAGISFGITLYSYAVSYLILPAFLILTLGYLCYIRKIKIRNIIALGIPMAIFAIPLILNLLVNKGIIPPIKLEYFSILKLWHYRVNEISIKNIVPNITLLKTIFSYDYNDFNSFAIFGTLYYISIPFAIIGLIETIKSSIKAIKQKEKSLDVIVLFIFISVLFCLMLLEGQAIYKSNAIYISLIYFIAIGIKRTIQNSKYLIYGIIVLYVLCFLAFQCYYFGVYGKENTNRSFNVDVIEITKYLENYKEKKIYLRTYAIQPYIYTLLGNQYSPSQFKQNLKSKGGNIATYDKYYFILPEEIQEDMVYVIKTPECENKALCEELRNKNFKEEKYQDNYLIFYYEKEN